MSVKVDRSGPTIRRRSVLTIPLVRRAGRSDWKGSRIRSWKRAMIRRKPSPPSLYLSTPSPETSPRPSSVISDWDADDEETMSTEDLDSSRPMSDTSSNIDIQSVGPYCPQRPSLPDVLSNSAPPPWTLSAFTAYLSQNHCLENLEFTMDADRYRERFDVLAAQMAGMPMTPEYEECNYLRMLWQRLLDAYIVPDGPREINIPSQVRETLLSLPNHTSPPRPEVLEAAVKIIYDLMEESVLVSFLNEVPSVKAAQSYNDQLNDSDENLRASRISSKERKSRRSRSRMKTSPSTSSLDIALTPRAPSRHPATSNFIVNSTRTGRARAPSHLSNGSGDSSMTDDSASATSPSREPMTPPTTPPSSDIGGSSPKGRNDTWKKMLGWKKKSSNGMRDHRFPTLED